MKILRTIVVLWGTASGLAAFAQAPPTAAPVAAPAVSPDEAQIRKNVQAYVDAFNRRDAKAIAAFWTEDSVYTNRTTGEQAVGPAQIQKDLEAGFAKGPPAKMSVAIEAIEFLSPGVAIERGVATVTAEKQPEQRLGYSAVHVKQGGKWLVDRITEDELSTAPTAYDRLKELEWMIGTWETPGVNGIGGATFTCQWAKNQNFMIRTFQATLPGEDTLSGIQVIGWDPSTRKIRSWVFDSDGGFGDGVWTRQNDRWTINASAVLPDGSRASSINTMKREKDGSIRWQITGREVDGEILPNLPEVVLKKSN